MSKEVAITGQADIAPMDFANGVFFNKNLFEHTWRVATMFSESTMVPDHFRSKTGNCMIALNFAARTGLDPFMVMQSMYIVHGKPGIEAKLVIALLNNTRKFSALQFKLEGEGMARKCTCHAKRLDTGEVCEQMVDMAMAKAEGWYDKKGSKWQTIPDLMLQYRSAAFFARVFCPEAILGMQSKEEIIDYMDATPGPNGTYTVTSPDTAEDLNAKLKTPAPEPTSDNPFADRSRFINLQKTGLEQFAKDHADRWEDADQADKAEFAGKWKRIFEDAPMPWEPVKGPEPPEEEPAPVPLEVVSEFQTMRKAAGEDGYAQALKEAGFESPVTTEDYNKVCGIMETIIAAAKDDDGGSF